LNQRIGGKRKIERGQKIRVRRKKKREDT